MSIQRTDDNMIPCITPRIDCEDAASLILFIDTFLPLLDVNDEDSRETAQNIFRVREKVHQTLGHFGDHIPKGIDPCPKP